MKRICFLFLLPVIGVAQPSTKFEIQSPSKKITLAVTLGDSIRFSAFSWEKAVLTPSAIALVIKNQKTAGVKSILKKSKTRLVNETIENLVPTKRKYIPDHYTELLLEFRENFSLRFRAYDDGIAYRFETSHKDSLTIIQEVASFHLPSEATVYWPEVQKRGELDIYHTSFEEPYRVLPISEIKNTQIAFSPVLADLNPVKLLITESDLLEYPGMFLKGTGGKSLRGEFAPYPAEEEVQGGEFKQWVVLKRENFIARTKGTRTFPWRVVGIAQHDKELLMNDLVYRLASPPSAGKDWSWVRPGISTEEWIIGNNLIDVDFKAGLNTATYKYYIDFASANGFRYVMLDAGWSDADDLFKINPGMDMEEITSYAKSKNIGLILWTLAMTLDRQLDEILPRFEKWGIKIVMTDFMDRDDQKTLQFYTRIAEATAVRKMMVMLHGAFKSAGFERTYPHNITREGILGSEYNIWSDKATPDHDLLIPFIRMPSGILDYEPGFIINANKQTFRPLPDMVMSQGTRVHQLAMFVVYESPLQLFAGNPSLAAKEKEYITFLGSIPTTWDDTHALDGKLGDYLVIARKKGNDWYVAAMGDWTARELEIDLSFLSGGNYQITTVEDGINASKNASDYRISKSVITRSQKLKINLAPGGGFVAKFSPVK